MERKWSFISGKSQQSDKVHNKSEKNGDIFYSRFLRARFLRLTFSVKSFIIGYRTNGGAEMVQKNTLLIVDDFEFNRLMLSDTFSDRNVIEAENGKRAIEEFELHKDELCAVLLDIMMPVMDGFGVLEYLVKNNYIDDIPVFIISADTSDKSLSRAYDLGAADVIAKPFNIRFVRRRINNIIELYNQRRHLRSVVSAQSKILDAAKENRGKSADK